MGFNGDIRKTQDYIKLPLLYNHWYVAGFTEEFDQEMKAKTLLELSIVFYRTETGELTALQNRCLHRSFPLSESIREGDDIICGYHGIRYNPAGEIVSIPSQSMCPKRQLRKYPVHEIGSLVLIWMGQAEADMSLLPKLPFLTDPSYATVHGDHYLKGNYLFMQENLNDLTHFAYLHRNTLGFDDSFFDIKPKVTETEEGVFCRRVETRRELAIRQLPPDIQERTKGKHVEKWDGGTTLSPGVHKGYAPTFIGEEGSKDREVLNSHIMHYVTPETATTTHYFWAISSDFLSQEILDMAKDGISAAFGEDAWAVEHMQNLMDVDRTDFQDMNLAADKPSVMLRKKFLEWAEAEYGEQLGAAQ